MLDHLRVGCVFSREIWFHMLTHVDLWHLTTMAESPLAEWRTRARKSIAKTQRKGIDSLVWLVAWSLWNERNGRVHECSALLLVALAPDIMEKARRWAHAGFIGFGRVLKPRLLLGH
ncbi:hypothetical protein HU200_038329 [Digitaria exilis]|uniref:Uncharacterized protein n=1 Tax=Digitaria exilis TaxID=1010633 RepID=A0A835EKG9_9POAL|nr:hypothetical protein HU200_038329 [Digitaria exilis]